MATENFILIGGRGGEVSEMRRKLSQIFFIFFCMICFHYRDNFRFLVAEMKSVVYRLPSIEIYIYVSCHRNSFIFLYHNKIWRVFTLIFLFISGEILLIKHNGKIMILNFFSRSSLDVGGKTGGGGWQEKCETTVCDIIFAQGTEPIKIVMIFSFSRKWNASNVITNICFSLHLFNLRWR